MARGVLLAAAIALLAAVPASASPYAPLNRPGPALKVPAAKLRASLSCTPGVRRGMARNPILLVPGTNLDPEPNFDWNYMRAFAARRWAHCAVTLPHRTMGDIQVAGEYVVHALRAISRRTGRRVDVLGYSQGGMLPRWALRFWPGTRALVDDLVGLAPSNHGTRDADVACQAYCPPAYWQQASGARFIAALNSRAETFRGVDYTVVYTHFDQVVTPNLDSHGSSSLHTGSGRIANIAVQDVCPANAADHVAIGTYDPVAYALAVDAFGHRGTAQRERVPDSTCSRAFHPGVNEATFGADYIRFVTAIGQAGQESPEVPAEPPLRCYTRASCRAG